MSPRNPAQPEPIEPGAAVTPETTEPTDGTNVIPPQEMPAEETEAPNGSTVEDVTAAQAAVDSYNANHAAETGEGE